MHAGRAFASTTVTVRQGGKLCTRSIALLHAPDDDLLRHAGDRPDAGKPEDWAPVGPRRAVGHPHGRRRRHLRPRGRAGRTRRVGALRRRPDRPADRPGPAGLRQRRLPHRHGHAAAGGAQPGRRPRAGVDHRAQPDDLVPRAGRRLAVAAAGPQLAVRRPGPLLRPGRRVVGRRAGRQLRAGEHRSGPSRRAPPRPRASGRGTDVALDTGGDVARRPGGGGHRRRGRPRAGHRRRAGGVRRLGGDLGARRRHLRGGRRGGGRPRAGHRRPRRRPGRRGGRGHARALRPHRHPGEQRRRRLRPAAAGGVGERHGRPVPGQPQARAALHPAGRPGDGGRRRGRQHRQRHLDRGRAGGAGLRRLRGRQGRRDQPHQDRRRWSWPPTASGSTPSPPTSRSPRASASSAPSTTRRSCR